MGRHGAQHAMLEHKINTKTRERGKGSSIGVEDRLTKRLETEKVEKKEILDDDSPRG